MKENINIEIPWKLNSNSPTKALISSNWSLNPVFVQAFFCLQTDVTQTKVTLATLSDRKSTYIQQYPHIFIHVFNLH